MKKYRVAVVGATGAVGGELLGILSEREFPLCELRLFASERSRGQTVRWCGEEYRLETLEDLDVFSGIDLVFTCTETEVSRRLVPQIRARGPLVIDDSAAFRMEPQVPLVVPEVNPEVARNHQGLFANANCSTIQLVMALKPLYDAAGIVRLVVSTYQAVSGTGAQALAELRVQTGEALAGRALQPEIYPHPIAFNLLPQIGAFDERGDSSEERKLAQETRKILGDDRIAITATTVRVPVFRSHSEAVNIETQEKLTAAQARELLARAPGISVLDEPDRALYPMPLEARGRDEVFVGRIREDRSIKNGLNLWVVSDNLRKGAALNTVQIGELLIERGWI